MIQYNKDTQVMSSTLWLSNKKKKKTTIYTREKRWALHCAMEVHGEGLGLHV